MDIPLIILCTIFFLIAVRQVGGLKLQIWQIMLGGAVLVLVTGGITPAYAVKSIDVDVMLFLFGMFVTGYALEESGYLAHISYKYFKRAETLNGLILRVLFGAGLLSALLLMDVFSCSAFFVILSERSDFCVARRSMTFFALPYGIRSV
jgi:Na+/H+ antiporter NhaD/arsenite permease-like protein